ncbi:MAG: NAD(P)H-quinone oxidoreductase [Chloroflexota bacterium]|nr:MAG: NADPH:quinone oxidoreductase [Chloroflexota bacterium]
MKAIIARQPGEADVLELVEVPDPTPEAGELLVRVRAAGVNRADILQRKGGYAPPPGASPILGLELAGEVVQAAGDWRVGDRVMAVVTGGAYAELATVPASVAMPVPAAFTDQQAAAIPEAFLTAYLNLFMLGRLQPGETVLIHAGASGVGTAAIQLARVAGARVLATASSPEKLARCEALGAEIAISYLKDSFGRVALEATGGRGVDLILDFVGAPYWSENLTSLARGGRLILIGFLGSSKGALDLGPVMRKNLTVTGTTLRGTPLEEKAALTQAFVEFALPKIECGELAPVLDSVYPLRDAAEAHRRMEANRNIGKIVLSV